jgi:hypothetical protein
MESSQLLKVLPESVERRRQLEGEREK